MYKSKLNYQSAFIIATVVALVSLYGNYEQDRNYAIAEDMNAQEVKELKQEAKDAKTVTVNGDKMTVETLKNKYNIILDEYNELLNENE